MKSVLKAVKLSVIVPVYNEEKTMHQILEQLLMRKEIFEIVIVDDCSNDGTKSILKKVKNTRVQIFHHETNQGKGAAIQTALQHVTGNFVLIQDADMEYDPSEIPILLQPIYAGRSEVVFGSRFYGAHTNMFYWHYVGNKLLNFFVSILYDTILSDLETCYKVLPTSLMKELKLKERDFRIEPEITCKLLRMKVRILEVPISYIGRSYTEGKKITWIDWFKAMYVILKIRLGILS